MYAMGLINLLAVMAKQVAGFVCWLPAVAISLGQLGVQRGLPRLLPAHKALQKPRNDGEEASVLSNLSSI